MAVNFEGRRQGAHLHPAICVPVALLYPSPQRTQVSKGPKFPKETQLYTSPCGGYSYLSTLYTELYTLSVRFSFCLSALAALWRAALHGACYHGSTELALVGPDRAPQ